MNDTMLRKFESYGAFWLPHCETSKVPGQITFDPEGKLKLILSGRFSSGRKFVGIMDDDSLPVVLGALTNGQLVTLTDGQQTSGLMGAGPSGPAIYEFTTVYLGINFDSLDELKISAFATSFTLLEQWASHTDITSQTILDEAGENAKEIALAYKYPPELIFEVPDAALTIKLSQQLSSDTHGLEITLKPSTFLEVTPSNPITQDDVTQIKWTLQNLFTLLTGFIVATRFIELRIDVPDDIAGRPYTAIDVLAVQTAKKPDTDKATFQMLLPLPSTNGKFEELLQKWFAKVKESKVALDVCFGSLYQPASVLNLRFLTVIQAFESYHRSISKGRYLDLDEKEFAALLAPIIPVIPSEIVDDHLTSFKNRLKYANEYSLRKRLKSVLMDLPEDLRNAIAIRVNRFVDCVVETRNQFTHYNQTPNPLVLKRADIYLASERIRVLVVAMLFLDLGIEKADLLGILRKSQKYLHAMYTGMDAISAN